MANCAHHRSTRCVLLLLQTVLLAALGSGCAAPTSDPAAGESVGTTSAAIKGVTLKTIAVTPTPATLFAGATEQLVAIGTYSDGSSQNLTSTATWSSSNTSVATVSPGIPGFVTTINHGSATITAGSGTVKGKATVTVPVTMMSIAVTPPSTTLPANATQALKATASYDNNTTKNLTSTVTWTSTNPSVATVSTAGLVSTVAPGTATIMASSSAASNAPIVGTATFTVDSATVTSVAVTPAKKSIPNGTTQQLTATATFGDGTTQVLVPPVVTWSSSNPSVATVSATGLVTSAGVGGPVTITATPLGSSTTGSSKITVTSATLVSVAVTPPTATVNAGLSQQFAATGTYSDTSTMDITGQVTWTSSATTIATTSSAGLATGVAAGNATITATDPKGKKTGTAALTVTPAVLASIALSPASPSVPAGLTGQLDALGTWTDGSTKDVTATVTWTSSATDVATVSPGGLVTALTQGTTTIGVVDPTTQVAQSETLSVTPGVLVSIAITPTNPSVPAGTTTQLAATGTYSDGSTADVTQSATWVSSSVAIAVANAPGPAGQVTAAGQGSAVVSATDPATGISGQTTVATSTAILESITVTPASATIPFGATAAFVATGTYSDGSALNITGAVNWTSSAASIVAFSGAAGLATGVSQGSATVTATDPATGINASASVTVTVIVLSLSLAPTSVTLLTGQTQQLTATATMSDGSTANDTASLSWSSSSASAYVASFGSAHGLVTGVSIGSSTITATDPGTGVNASVPVTVSMNTSDDAAQEFSPYVNPVGNWTFGWEPSVGGPFTTFTDATSDGQDSFWSDPGLGPTLAVVENTSSSVTPYGAPGQLALYAAQTGDDAVVRWTAPESGVYQIGATFSGPTGPTSCVTQQSCTTSPYSCGCYSCNCHCSFGGCYCNTCCNTCEETSCVTTDTCGNKPAPTSVGVLHNGAAIHVDSPGSAPYSASFTLAAGDTMDFEVGNPGGGSSTDLTIFDAQIATCASAGLSSCGGACTNTASDPNNCGACGTRCGMDCVGGACVGGPGFAAPILYPAPPVGGTTYESSSVASADFDGDGHADFVLANTTNVLVFLGRGDGSFWAAVSSGVPSGAFALATGDFNRDGKIDVATVNSDSAGAVSILLGNGDGTFQTTGTYPVSTFSLALTVGDINGDGTADIATLNGSGNISVLLGNGDGTLQAAATYALGSYTFSIASADLNGDGRVDLVVADEATSPDTATVLLSNSDGTLQAGVSYPAVETGGTVATGDFNGDGKVDLVLAGGPSASILLGNGDGTFQAAVNYAFGGDLGGYASIATGDLNGDGVMDLAFACAIPSNGISPETYVLSDLLGNGDGTFGSSVSYSINGYPYGALAQDFNGDGRADLVIAVDYSGPATNDGANILVKTGNGG